MATVVCLSGTPAVGSRRVLTDSQMRGIVGGEAAAVTFKKPEGVFTMVNDTGTGSLRTSTVFNLKGNRCQYNLTTGKSNVGFDVTASGNPSGANFIFVLHGSAAPKLEVWEGSGGTATRRIAIATATLAGSDSCLEFDGYTASLRTKCVGGTNDGQLCHTTESCPGGFCRTCDQAGNCNSNTNPSGPCTGQCLSGSNGGGPCLINAECPGSFCISNPRFETNAGCFLLTGCCSSSGCTNCVSNGVDKSGSGPFHAAVARVTHGSGIILGYAERVIRMENGNSNDPKNTCSTDCDGPVDASAGGVPPPTCEN